MYFGSNAKVCCDPTLDYDKVAMLTSDSDRGFRSELAYKCGGGTDNPLGVYSDWLDTKMDTSDAQADVLLILTDGAWMNTVKAVQDSKELKMGGVTIIGIGTPGANLEFLKKISTSDSYAGLFDFSELGTAFSSIGRSISSGSGISI